MIGIYIKVNERGKEEEQLKTCKSLLNDNEDEEFGVYSDIGNTRVAREELLNKINNGYITSVITYNLSRISRDHKETMNILQLLNDKNIKLITVENGVIDESTFSIFSNLDEIEERIMKVLS